MESIRAYLQRGSELIAVLRSPDCTDNDLQAAEGRADDAHDLHHQHEKAVVHVNNRLNSCIARLVAQVITNTTLLKLLPDVPVHA